MTRSGFFCHSYEGRKRGLISSLSSIGHEMIFTEKPVKLYFYSEFLMDVGSDLSGLRDLSGLDHNANQNPGGKHWRVYGHDNRTAEQG
jgi:hypothetical protein